MAVDVWIGLLVAQGLLVAAAPVLLRFVAERAVGHAFDRRLENHKAQLAALNDTVRFELQRQLADVSHFAAKRHEVSAELYHSLRRAHGAVAGLFGLSRSYTYEEFNETDLIGVMDDRRVPQGKREQILVAFRVDRGRGIEDMKSYFRLLDVNVARRAYEDANNLILLNEIYLSDEVVDASKNVIKLLHGILFDAEHPPQRGERSGSRDREDPIPALSEVRAAMRRELGRGYSGDVQLASTQIAPGTPSPPR